MTSRIWLSGVYDSTNETINPDEIDIKIWETIISDKSTDVDRQSENIYPHNFVDKYVYSDTQSVIFWGTLAI